MQLFRSFALFKTLAFLFKTSIHYFFPYLLLWMSIPSLKIKYLRGKKTLPCFRCEHADCGWLSFEGAVCAVKVLSPNLHGMLNKGAESEDKLPAICRPRRYFSQNGRCFFFLFILILDAWISQLRFSINAPLFHPPIYFYRPFCTDIVMSGRD